MIDSKLALFARELSDESSKVIKKYYLSKDLDVDIKSDASPVTLADRGAEEIIRKLVNQRYPDHGIIGEEFGKERPEAEFVWMIDPIDGTQSFIRGCPLFGSLICLLQNGKPVLGAINFPALNIFCIGDGKKSTVNNNIVKVKQTQSLADASLMMTDPKMISKFQNQEGFDLLISKVSFVRTWGDCYGYYLLAAGYADIMLDPIMNPWDLMALIPIIEGAGGKISAWDGSSVLSASSCVASSPEIHNQVLECLNKA